jgi:integrase
MENVDGYSSLKVRNGTFYWRETIKGRKYFESLHVPFTGKKPELNEALQRMAEKQRLARNENFTALDETRTKVGYVSIGKVLERYKLSAASYGLADKTIKGNILALKLVVRSVHAADAEGLSTAVLTDKLVQTYRDTVLAARPKTEAEQDTARRTIRSTLRAARSIFARWVMAEYKGLKLPELDGFLHGASMRVHDKLYAAPPAELVQKTIEAARKLPEAGKLDLFAVFILCYEFGLRSGEAVEAKKDWIGSDFLEVKAGKQWTIRRRGRRIPFNPETLADLKRVIRKDEEFILPGAHFTAREDLVKRDFAAWMRGLGWDVDEYGKAAHELRKLKGSRWYTDQGANVARDLLGHTSVVTTCKFYAALDRLPDALPRERP